MRRLVLETARKFRKNQTNEEKIVWEIVRSRRLFNLKFTRQYPIEFVYENQQHFFVADFYCAFLRLILEIDGKIHLANKHKDNFRDNILTELGYKVLRIKNDEIMENRENVAIKIKPLIPPSLMQEKGAGGMSFSTGANNDSY